MTINQFKIWGSNHGLQFYTSQRPGTHGFGVFWPGGIYASKLFGEALSMFWVGNYSKEFVMPTYGRLKYLRPGTIEDLSISPFDPSLRVYRIRKGWESLPPGDLRNEFELDYNEWPVASGAPWTDKNSDGIFTRGVDEPIFVGDEQLWHVSNYADSSFKPHDLLFYGKTNFKFEERIITYAFNRSNILKDAVFINYELLNKDTVTIDSAFILISENFFEAPPQRPDSMYRSWPAIDSAISLAYVYYKNNSSYYYDIAPAAGIVILSSESANSRPLNKHSNLYSFTTSIIYDTNKHSFYGISPKQQFYHNSRGRFENGDPIINPLTGQESRFIFTGDPITQTGWTAKSGLGYGVYNQYIGPSIKLSIGPTTFEPNDTIRIVLAVIVAQGTDNLNSIEVLRRNAQLIKRAYQTGFKPPEPPPAPKVQLFEQEGKVTLWWDNAPESYDVEDFMITGQNLPDTTYSFEGYRIWQFTDSLGSNPREIALFDLVNGVTVIEDNIIANGLAVKAPVIIGKDNGLQRYIHITKDIFSGAPLAPGLPYYFGVSAYSYNRFSSPSYTESPPEVITVFPARKKIDFSTPYMQGNEVLAPQTKGISKAKVRFKIIDPSAIQDGIYNISFRKGGQDTLFYSVTNTSTGEQPLANAFDFTQDTLSKSIQQGWMMLIEDPDKLEIQKLSSIYQPFGIRSITLANGDSIVNTGQGSLGGWELRAVNIQSIDVYNSINKYDYEIRFTGNGSEYFTTGYTSSDFLLRDDPKGKGRLPFEVWDITNNKQLFIKVYDNLSPADTAWSQRQSNKDWERFYCYLPGNTVYTEPLAVSSGTLSKPDFRLGELIIRGNLPPVGTVISITTFKPVMEGDEFSVELSAAKFNDAVSAQNNLGNVTVYPNPYLATNKAEWGLGKAVRFLGLPKKATIRIFTIAGRLVKTLEHDDLFTQHLDWDLTNQDGVTVAGGIYIAHVSMENIGTKILKLAVIPEKGF